MSNKATSIVEHTAMCEAASRTELGIQISCLYLYSGACRIELRSVGEVKTCCCVFFLPVYDYYLTERTGWLKT